MGAVGPGEKKMLQLDRRWEQLRKTDNGKCPLILGEQNVKHIPLNSLGTRRWGKELLNNKTSNARIT